ncbi:MAG: 50S ribosomal protein L21 [Candidatus Kryptonium sp.]|nr:50S ribosomal protein L21 [Candidatus Kryptonium sp.]MCX7763027.1 50S ribosomal protein L21 [Candidatus Kryptonium sp.]MDW8109962.1 50S ribosomal protein L21 [Candidatus Kryptonium sp.]
MLAVVKIGGHQYKVKENDKIFVQKLEAEPGSKVKFETVLLLQDEGKTYVGNPYITGAFVEATILDHVKGEKIIVFKKKRRKGYKVTKGHRQNYTQIEINKISFES